MIEKTILLTVDQLLRLTSYSHWIPILNGRHQEFITKNYPGWEWHQIIPVLVKAKILKTDSKVPGNRALNQGLYISRDITEVKISIRNHVTVLEVRRNKINALDKQDASNDPSSA